MCSKQQQKQQQQRESFFGCFFVPLFPHFLFKTGQLFVPHHGIIKPTKTPRFCAAFKVQAGISGSAFLSSSSACVCFCFCFCFSFWALNLSRSSSSSSSSSLYVLFSKVFPGDPFFSSSNLPRDDDRVSCPRRRRRKRSRGEV